MQPQKTLKRKLKVSVNKQYLYSDLTDKIIRAAIEVHKQLGPGLVEKLYQRALKIELARDLIKAEREKKLELSYKGKEIGFDRVDFDVEGKVLVEIKAVSELSDIHKAQMISYLKSSKRNIGLLLNFAKMRLEVKRIILETALTQRLQRLQEK